MSNVVSARDYFEANGTAYMVMEYVEGVTLKEYLEKKGGRISFEEARGIMMPVMDALREVHQAGMLHRDVSPDNIYITTSAQVKILDFGAARYFAGEQSKSLSVILKPGYAPEEQYRSSGKQGAWTDVYAVGATIYKALTGKPPPDALDRMAGDTLEPPSRLGVSIPLPAEQVLLQALAVNAGQRFHAMGEFQQALLGNAAVTMGFQPASAPFQPAPEPSYTPCAAPVSAPPQPSVYPPPPPSHYPQVPRRSANPAAIAAGIGAGVLGLVLLVVLIWRLVVVPPPSADVTPPKGGGQKTDTPTSVPPVVQPPVTPFHRPEFHWGEPGTQLALSQALFEQGRTYFKENKFPEAIEKLQASIQLDPSRAMAHYLLGWSFNRVDRSPEALEQFKWAIVLKSDYALAHDGLAWTYNKLNRFSEAIVASEQAVRLNYQFPDAQYNLGMAYLGLGNRELAVRQYNILQKMNRDKAAMLLASLQKSDALQIGPNPSKKEPRPEGVFNSHIKISKEELMNANYILPGGTRLNFNKGICVVNNSNRYVLDKHIISNDGNYAITIITEQDGNAINEYLSLFIVTHNLEIINTDTQSIERYIDSISLYNNIIDIDLLIVGQNDSQSKHTLRKKTKYQIIKDKLVKINK